MPEIYHITHVRNLALILNDGGFLCDRDTAKNHPTGIAHRNIKERRARRIVTAGPGGVLSDYVPFYFAPRSPMLYAIHKGAVEGYDEGQAQIVHMVSSTELVADRQLAFVFTDGHADMRYSRFFDNLDQLDNIDWDVMKTRYWRDTLEDDDRCRRRQAEFLVLRYLPWNLINKIGVINEARAQEVRDSIGSAAYHPDIVIERGWYYY